MYATTTQYHVDIMFTFLMADLRPIGSQISGLQFEGSQLTGIYLERVPFDGSHSAEKKQVDIDGLKPTVSSRKKEGSIWKHFTIFTIVFWLRSYGCVINHWTRRWDPCRGSFWEFEMSMHRICSSEDWAILSHCSSSELLFCLHIWMTCTGSAVDKLVLRPLLPIG